MDHIGTTGGVESQFSTHVERLAPTFGHADRTVPFRAYCRGLILPGDRKSVAPMAARMEPDRAGAAHQSLRHFIAKVAWDDARVRDLVLPTLLERAAFPPSGPPLSGILEAPKLPEDFRRFPTTRRR